MTDFVESFTTQQLLPPWYSHGAKTWMFLVKANKKLMQDYLDEHFNDPGPDVAPYYYEPWSDPCFGFLQFVDHVNFSSEHARPDLAPGVPLDDTFDPLDDHQHWDTLQHREVFFTFPAARYRRTSDNLLIDKKLVWIQPFFFDNSSYVMFSSREIWGSEKEMAMIDIEYGDTRNQLHIDVSIDGFKKFDPHSISERIGVMHLRMDQTSEQTLLGTMKDKSPRISDIIDSLKGYLPDAWLDATEDKKLHLPTFKINTLKQYRDVFNMHDAAYRAIIASEAAHSDITDLSVFHGKRVDVQFLWSDSMKETFETLFDLKPPKEDAKKGIDGSGTAVVPDGIDWDMPAVKLEIELAVFFTSNAHFDVLGTLFTYGGGPQYPPPDARNHEG